MNNTKNKYLKIGLCKMGDYGRYYYVYKNVPKNEYIEKMFKDSLDEDKYKLYEIKSSEYWAHPYETRCLSRQFKIEKIEEIINGLDISEEEKTKTKEACKTIQELDKYIEEREKLEELISYFLKDCELCECDEKTYDRCEYKLTKSCQQMQYSN